MHTVCETFIFEAAAKDAGMSRDEVEAFMDIVAADPHAGDRMEETGGCRKVRFAKPGRGKSGGYRIVTYFGGADIPVFCSPFSARAKSPTLPSERNSSSRGSPRPLPMRIGRRSSTWDRHDEQEGIRQDRRRPQ